MIIYKLNCKECLSEFEGWFDNSNAFNKQKKNNLISCPSCSSIDVDKSLMAPNIGKKSNAKNIKNNKKTVINKIEKYKKMIEKNFDYVGENFTNEAKKIKYGEASERPIYGEANVEQTQELIDEEISIVPLPWTPTKKSN